MTTTSTREWWEVQDAMGRQWAGARWAYEATACKLRDSMNAREVYDPNGEWSPPFHVTRYRTTTTTEQERVT